MSENSSRREQDAIEPQPLKKREPFFNKLPTGVVIMASLMIATHFALIMLDPRMETAINQAFGTTPAYIFAAAADRNIIYPLIVLVASQFMHGGTLHLVMNLAMLVQVGPIAEAGFRQNRLAPLKLILLFLLSGIGGGLTFCAVDPGSFGYAIGASGSISGVFAGFLWAAIGLARPGQRMLQPVISTAAVFLLINVGLAAVGRELGALPIAWESHLGGFLAGLILYPVIARLGPKPKIKQL